MRDLKEWLGETLEWIGFISLVALIVWAIAH